MEFSLKCDQEILLVVFDKKSNQYVEYKSSEEFDLKMVKRLKNIETTLSRERYGNDDFVDFDRNVTEKQM